MVDFDGFHVGKYSSPMENIPTQKPEATISRKFALWSLTLSNTCSGLMFWVRRVFGGVILPARERCAGGSASLGLQKHSRHFLGTVDERNPAPPGMYRTLEIVGYLLSTSTGADFLSSTVWLFVPSCTWLPSIKGHIFWINKARYTSVGYKHRHTQEICSDRISLVSNTW